MHAIVFQLWGSCILLASTLAFARIELLDLPFLQVRYPQAAAEPVFAMIEKHINDETGEVHYVFLRSFDRAGNIEFRGVPIDEATVIEIQKSYEKFMTSDLYRYGVRRKTAGFAEGRPLMMAVTLNRRGQLLRYEGDEKFTLPEMSGKQALIIDAAYQFKDADREKKADGRTDPRGRIILGEDGKINYVNYSKSVRVHEQNEDGTPALMLDTPAVREALDLANAGDPSKLRFAADFGPQGLATGNQLMPIIPIDLIAQEGERWVVFLPPDQLKAYREGLIPKSALFLIPADAVRYVPDSTKWNGILDDYSEVRVNAEPMHVFVANRQSGSKGQTLSIRDTFEGSPNIEDRIVDPDKLSASILSLARDAAPSAKSPAPTAGDTEKAKKADRLWAFVRWCLRMGK